MNPTTNRSIETCNRVFMTCDFGCQASAIE